MPATIPWVDFRNEPSYGPSVRFYVQSLCYDVRDKYGRPVAVKLIHEYGKAKFTVDVNPIHYAGLIDACRAALHD